MKKFLITLIAVVLIGGASYAGYNYMKNNDSSQATSEKVLHIGTEGNYAPFSYHDSSGNLTGFDVDVAKAVADKMGYKTEFVEAPWDSLIAGFDANKTDVVFNQVSITEERTKKYDFSTPYNISHAALITAKDNNTIKDFSDLKNKKSAQSVSSNYAAEAEKYGASLVTAEGFSEAVELVINKQADATLNDDISYYDYLKQKPDAPIKIVKKSHDATKVAALLHKNDQDLKEKVDRSLEELSNDGTLKKLSEKYFNKDITK